MRPDVVWFGEPIPVAVLSAATIAASTCDLFISAGTAAMVEPAASLAGHAKRNGALLVEINTELTNLSAGVDFMLQGPAATLLPALVAGLQ
jgi:NAD-dependent deacetylase